MKYAAFIKTDSGIQKLIWGNWLLLFLNKESRIKTASYYITYTAVDFDNDEVFCEHSNEPSGSVKGSEFLDELSPCYLAPWSHVVC
jgi:hypothetical protein